jgi:hypothetical protein
MDPRLREDNNLGLDSRWSLPRTLCGAGTTDLKTNYDTINRKSKNSALQRT